MVQSLESRDGLNLRVCRNPPKNARNPPKNARNADTFTPTGRQSSQSSRALKALSQHVQKSRRIRDCGRFRFHFNPFRLRILTLPLPVLGIQSEGVFRFLQGLFRIRFVAFSFLAVILSPLEPGSPLPASVVPVLSPSASPLRLLRCPLWLRSASVVAPSPSAVAPFRFRCVPVRCRRISFRFPCGSLAPFLWPRSASAALSASAVARSASGAVSRSASAASPSASLAAPWPAPVAPSNFRYVPSASAVFPSASAVARSASTMSRSARGVPSVPGTSGPHCGLFRSCGRSGHLAAGL